MDELEIVPIKRNAANIKFARHTAAFVGHQNNILDEMTTDMGISGEQQVCVVCVVCVFGSVFMC